MSKLREAARGRECQVRLVGVCNFDSATTVLAHARLPGVTGTALKAPDVAGAWCCSACHDEVDRRTTKIDRDAALLAFYEGVIRTIYQLTKLGILKA